jgi:hypothetical protein
MAFNVRVIFSGLCAYVPNSPLGDSEASPTKMMVVMVDARKSKMSLDEENKLQPHFPIIFLRGHQVPGVQGLPPRTDLGWRIDRKQIKIVIPEEALDANKFSVFQREKDEDGLLTHDKDFSFGADLQTIVPGFSEIDPKVFEDQGSKDLVAARILLDKGALSTFDLGDSNWKFPGTDFTARRLSNRSLLELKDLKALTLVATDLDGGASEEVSLQPSKQETVEIFIGNFCTGCMPMLLHVDEATAIQLQHEIVPDDDFRWFYELSREREGLKGLDLPIPTPDEGGKGNEAAKCMQATFAPVDFGS